MFWIKWQQEFLEFNLLLKQVCNSGLSISIGHAAADV
jgi:hypothetical protein